MPFYPNSSPDYRFCNFLTPLPLSSRRPSVSIGGFGLMRKWDMPTTWADPDVVPYAARVSVWGRWFIWFAGVFGLV